MRVLVVEAIAPEGLAYLREHGVDVDELAKASPAELRARLPDYEGLITRSGTAVTAELLDHAPRLRIVGRAGVGVDNVDVEACSRRGSWSATRRTATSSPPPSTRSACSWRWCAASPRRTRGSRPWSGIGGSTAPSSTVRLSAS